MPPAMVDAHTPREAVMKIDNTCNPYRLLPSRPKPDATAPEFKEIFHRTVTESALLRAPGEAGNAELMEKSRLLLDVLDDYGHRLADPGTSLKELSPLVQQVEHAASRLESCLPPEDKSELAGFVRNARIAAKVAVMKYQRGDFV
jgi:hypothetical protein